VITGRRLLCGGQRDLGGFGDAGPALSRRYLLAAPVNPQPFGLRERGRIIQILYNSTPSGRRENLREPMAEKIVPAPVDRGRPRAA
jgi:hypothetical protein